MVTDDRGIGGGDSLCWTCLRAGWACLCQWPVVLLDGATVAVIAEDGEELQIIKSCSMYWPDSRAAVADRRAVDNEEEKEAAVIEAPARRVAKRERKESKPFTERELNIMGYVPAAELMPCFNMTEPELIERFAKVKGLKLVTSKEGSVMLKLDCIYQLLRRGKGWSRVT